MRFAWICFVAALFIIASAGCGESSGGEAPSEGAEVSGGGELTVFAAASLMDAFEELGEDFEEENPGVEVSFNFTSSSTLATQIIQGAPADVFASADEAQMENAGNENLLAGEPEIFAENREVVVVPEGNPAGAEEFGDLAQPDIRLVLALEEVPAAEYAEKIIGNASEESEYGPDFEEAVLGNIISREEDVRASVNRVVIGDADATFAYASDVTPSVRDEVEVVEIPEDLQVVPTYPIAILEGSEEPEIARAWVDLVLSEDGQRILGKWGFEPVAQ
ncbi:MAG: molybdate ABC transporter substrate-binding protein [Actinomycetota bacterium]|nr:molybdate ABC transporter substrate-binding protein [Rubrobacter sp.]MDQ3506652.1 molybdate ABC transporter substrate-binding protein [Actinomycetota bacterium]